MHMSLIIESFFFWKNLVFEGNVLYVLSQRKGLSEILTQ
jgi:hypothetical protein